MNTMDRNQVVLVDEKDRVLGSMEKLEAHEKGVLHRAFSIFVLNDKNEILMQQRADSKYHGGGLWTNTCCSHPQLDEELLQAAAERLKFEMGMEAQLKYAFSFLYKGEVENNLIEHELDHVILGYSNQNPQINPDEVKDFKWVSIESLDKDRKEHPEKYTIWFKECFDQVKEALKM